MNRRAGPWIAVQAAFILACALGIGSTDIRAAEPADPWSRTHLTWPGLVEDKDSELCSIVLASAQRWFASPSSDAPDLRASKLEVRSAKPMAGRSDLPFEPKVLALDLDGDHRDEVLLVTTENFRMEDFQGGVILRSEADVETVLRAKSEERAKSGAAKYPSGMVVLKPRAFDDSGDWSVDLETVFVWKGQYHLASVLTHTVAQAGIVLQRLDANGALSTICEVATADPGDAAATMRESREIRALLAAREAIGHSGGTCGTSNAGTRSDNDAADAVLVAAVRPWTLTETDDGRSVRDSRILWQFLADWSLDDPWNRREYLTLLETLEPARRAFAKYLQKNFGFDVTAARVRGDRAIEALIASRFWIPNELFEDVTDDTADDAYSERPYPAYGATMRVRSDAGYTNDFGKTALMTAVHMNRIDIVRDLLTKGADPNAVTRELLNCDYSVRRGMRSAIMYAAENANPLIMKVLIDAGASLEVGDSSAYRPADYLGWNPRLSDEEKHLPIKQLAATASDRADAPGFDCRRARTRAEKAICASEALRLLDSEMTDAYQRALPVVDFPLRADQKRWNTWRSRECAEWSGQEFHDCLADQTAARERYLHYLLGS